MKKFPSAFDVQEGGDHYKKFKIQPNLFITENELDFNQANVVKLICRHKDKNGIGDIKKIIHYARIILEQEYGLKSDIQYDEPTKITAPKRLRRKKATKALTNAFQKYREAQTGQSELMEEKVPS